MKELNEIQKLAIEGLRRNFEIYKKPYCPCLNPALFSQPNHEDFICKCKEFREGRGCHCGLFTDREVSQCK